MEVREQLRPHRRGPAARSILRSIGRARHALAGAMLMVLSAGAAGAAIPAEIGRNPIAVPSDPPSCSGLRDQEARQPSSPGALSDRQPAPPPGISRGDLRLIAFVNALVGLWAAIFGVQTVRFRRSGMEGASGIVNMLTSIVLVGASVIMAMI